MLDLEGAFDAGEMINLTNYIKQELRTICYHYFLVFWAAGVTKNYWIPVLVIGS